MKKRKPHLLCSLPALRQPTPPRFPSPWSALGHRDGSQVWAPGPPPPPLSCHICPRGRPWSRAETRRSGLCFPGKDECTSTSKALAAALDADKWLPSLDALLTLGSQPQRLPAFHKHLRVRSVSPISAPKVPSRKLGRVIYSGNGDRTFSKATGTFPVYTSRRGLMDALAFGPDLHAITIKPCTTQPC